MIIAVEYEIEASADNPNAALDAECVAKVLARRIVNREVSVLWDSFQPSTGGPPIKFIATVRRYGTFEANT